MKILQRYFLSQILRSVLFVLFAFLGLFAFFDLIGELSSVGRGGYQLQHVLIYILLGFPGYIYELMPFAVLIGTIYALAMFASNSEYTIMRVSSLSTLDAAGCWQRSVLFSGVHLSGRRSHNTGFRRGLPLNSGIT